MKKFFVLFILVTILLPSVLSAEVFGKVGTAGLQFLKMGVDARAAGMAEAFVSVTDDVSAIYYNPGGLALLEENQVMLSHKQYVAGIMQDYIAASFITDYATFGIHVNYLHMDQMDEISEDSFEATGRTFTNSDLSIGLTYSNDFTDKFSFGFTVKYLRENLYDYDTNGFSFDLGSQYNIGYKNLTIGMALRDYGPNMKYTVDNDNDGETDEDPFDLVDNDGDGLIDEDREELDFKLPMTFSLGVSMDIFRDDVQSLVLATQVDNVVDRKEVFTVGGEYQYSMIALRAGYNFSGKNIASETSFGVGVKIPTSFSIIYVDLSHVEMGNLQESFIKSDNRLTVKFSF